MNARKIFETVKGELQLIRMYERHKQELTTFLSEVCGDDQERQQELQEIRKAEKAILQQALSHVRQAEQIIGSMSDGVNKSLLYAHYLLGLNWKETGKELGYSGKTTRDFLRTKALQEAQKVLDSLNQNSYLAALDGLKHATDREQ